MKTKIIILLILIPALLVSGCSLLAPPEQPDFWALQTQVAATTIFELTKVASFPTPTPTLPLPSATVTAVPPTATDLPTATATVIVPTAVPQATSTPTAIPCNRVQFIEDITIPDGTDLAPGESFTKIWKLKNTGSCNWTTDYDLVFGTGTRMAAPDAKALPGIIVPGETIELSLNLTAPLEAGTYTAYFQLRAANGSWFGIGSAGNGAFWTKIDVPEPENAWVYDFAHNFCTASWKSGAGELSCPGEQEAGSGFVQLINNPKLENTRENEPALWLRPNHVRDGWIQGTFPAVRIRDGYRFRTIIGCLADSKQCDLDFTLSYQIGKNDPQVLGTWNEVFDGNVTELDIDLSVLAGEKVNFIIKVETHNRKYDWANGFMLAPRILDNPVVPTPTNTPTPTLTPSATPTPTYTPTPLPTFTPLPTRTPTFTPTPSPTPSKSETPAPLPTTMNPVALADLENVTALEIYSKDTSKEEGHKPKQILIIEDGRHLTYLLILIDVDNEVVEIPEIITQDIFRFQIEDREPVDFIFAQDEDGTPYLWGFQDFWQEHAVKLHPEFTWMLSSMMNPKDENQLNLQPGPPQSLFELIY